MQTGNGRDRNKSEAELKELALIYMAKGIPERNVT
jgi:hypothetical protein